MIIDKELINEIRSRVNIVDVIGSYIPITKKGRSYEAICPFHDDHDPSLKISEEKQIYRCFVCGNGGNVFNFVMNYENIGFQEAVIKVADFAGVEIDKKYIKNNREQQVDPKKQKNSDLLNDVIQYTQYELNSVVAKEHKEYLKSRAIGDKIIDQFLIGYNPKDNKVSKFLKLKGYSDNEIVASGMASFNNNELYDFFKDRITIPIHDSKGLCVGFTARTIDPNNSAKYINTFETEFYKKREILFNYHRVKKDIKAYDDIIVCEGAMDVIGLAKGNINNAVATLGTACSDEQIKLLKFLKCKIKVFYDGDEAGQKATYKLGKLAHKYYLNIEVVNNTTNKDPDEIFMEYGEEKLKSICDMTMSYIEFLIDYLPNHKYNLNNFSDMREFVEEIATELEFVQSDLEKQLYIDKIKEITGYDLSKYHKEEHHTHQRKITSDKNVDGINLIQERILQLLMMSKQGAELFNSQLGFLPNEDYQKIAIYVIDYYRTHEYLEVSEFIDMIDDEVSKGLIIKLSEDNEVPEEYKEEYLIQSINRLKKYLSKNKEQLLLNKLRNSEGEEADKILKELVNLKKEMNS